MKREQDHSKYQNWIDPNEVRPYERNVKIHTDKQVANIARSIKKFGWQQDTVITRDKVLVIGHGRRLAALKLGCEMPYHVVDKDADELTDKDIRELRIADNLSNSETGYDFDLGAVEIADLEFDGFDFDLSEWGNSEEELKEVVEDEPPEKVETRCKMGDIWQMGGVHRLMCGDSTDPAVIDRLMDGVKAKLLLTDPPYGIDYGGMLKGKGDGKGGADKNGWKSYDAPTWDIERPDESVFSYIITLADESIIWGGNYFADILPPKMCWLVWDKGQRDFSLADGELAWTSFDKALRIKTYSRASANREEKVHPTQKPIELLRWCIEDIAERNMESADIILDLFGGSGSTLIACEQLKRKCYMMELDPHYCDVILQRWENLTGKKAELVSRRDEKG